MLWSLAEQRAQNLDFEREIVDHNNNNYRLKAFKSPGAVYKLTLPNFPDLIFSRSVWRNSLRLPTQSWVLSRINDLHSLCMYALSRLQMNKLDVTRFTCGRALALIHAHDAIYLNWIDLFDNVEWERE